MKKILIMMVMLLSMATANTEFYIEYGSYHTFDQAKAASMELEKSVILSEFNPTPTVSYTLTGVRSFFVKLTGFDNRFQAKEVIKVFRWEGWAYVMENED